jgi:hypothetical protein
MANGGYTYSPFAPYRIIHTLQKYVLTPPIKLALAIDLPLPGYALLETKGQEREATPHTSGRCASETSSGLWQSMG